SGIEADSNFGKALSETKLLPSQPTISGGSTITNPSSNIIQISPYDDVEDIAHETAEDESLSLEQKEKEMIVKALQRSNGKRKYAAQALGISERTLYRKIKQYDIEEE
ncbi:MAG: helix-turn-helix domain-containing protein, partial [Runella zeae]